jgi:hypothetical protein
MKSFRTKLCPCSLRLLNLILVATNDKVAQIATSIRDTNISLSDLMDILKEGVDQTGDIVNHYKTTVGTELAAAQAVQAKSAKLAKALHLGQTAQTETLHESLEQYGGLLEQAKTALEGYQTAAAALGAGAWTDENTLTRVGEIANFLNDNFDQIPALKHYITFMAASLTAIGNAIHAMKWDPEQANQTLQRYETGDMSQQHPEFMFGKDWAIDVLNGIGSGVGDCAKQNLMKVCQTDDWNKVPTDAGPGRIASNE